ncbi:MAG: transposase [Boseongicola sp. SB0662_bin_57]|nr:transposase [Boseongicola sp. SB0662_bin_57]
MTRSAKGTVAEPGTNVPRKSGLNRVILNTGWTALKAMLECKAANVIAVPARNTSRTCHECGAAEAASRRTRDDFICVACGHAAHADINAARNIRGVARGRVPEHEASGIDASGVPGQLVECRRVKVPAGREVNQPLSPRTMRRSSRGGRRSVGKRQARVGLLSLETQQTKCRGCQTGRRQHPPSRFGEAKGASRGRRTMARVEAVHRDLGGLQVAPLSCGAATQRRNP